MVNRKFILIAVTFIVFLIINTGFCGELDGWIIGDMCWVVEGPNINGKIIGIISKKSAVIVKDAENDWLKIIYAPVRDLKAGKWIECSGCYIQKKNFTTRIPSKW